MRDAQARFEGVGFEIVERPATAGAEAHDRAAVCGQRVAETDEDVAAVGGVDEGQDVAGGDDDVEVAGGVLAGFGGLRVRVGRGQDLGEVGQVADLPRAAGLDVAGDGDQVRVDVHADDPVAPAGEVAAQAALTAARVEDASAPRGHRVDQPRFAVDVASLRGEIRPAFRVPAGMAGVGCHDLGPGAVHVHGPSIAHSPARRQLAPAIRHDEAPASPANRDDGGVAKRKRLREEPLSGPSR